MSKFFDLLPSTEELSQQVWITDDADNEPDPEHFRPVVDETHEHAGVPGKPAEGGLWTSTYSPEEDTVSDWARWCAGNHWWNTGREAFLLEPARDLRILEIDGVQDLVLAMEAYPADTKISQIIPDVNFELLSQEGWDGVHLTAKGQRDTRFSQPSFYGWDCESTLWLDWSFEDWQYLGTVTEDGSLEN